MNTGKRNEGVSFGPYHPGASAAYPSRDDPLMERAYGDVIHMKKSKFSSRYHNTAVFNLSFVDEYA